MASRDRPSERANAPVTARADPHPAPSPVPASSNAGWRAVFVLTILYWFGTLDRQIAALLVPLIKADLYLTDLQISLIQGLAFGLFFMLASPVMGWLVDRHSRRLILFCGVVGWSMSAVASGLSRNFFQLFSARAGVGAGEAAINPTAYAMLSELFPAGRLSLPMSIFALGGNLGSGMSFVLGGAVISWIATSPQVMLPYYGPLSGWQLAFIITGIPGILLAPLIWTIPESRQPVCWQDRASSGFTDLWDHYRRYPVFYLTHNGGFALVMAFVVGLQSWNATFLVRHYGWAIADIGFWLGSTQIGSALVGLAFHGWAVDKLFSGGRRDAHLVYFMAMCLLALPCGIAAYLVQSGVTMIVLYNMAYFFLMSFASIGPAALQIATPPALRGKASALYMVGLSIIGSILGPIIVASFTDLLFGDEAKLGYSMALFAAITMGGSALLFRIGMAPMRRAVGDAMSVATVCDPITSDRMAR